MHFKWLAEVMIASLEISLEIHILKILLFGMGHLQEDKSRSVISKGFSTRVDNSQVNMHVP